MQIAVSFVALIVAILALILGMFNYSKTQSSHTRQIRINQSIKIIGLCKRYMQEIEKIYDDNIFPDEQEYFYKCKEGEEPESLITTRIKMKRYYKLQTTIGEELKVADLEGELFFEEKTREKIVAVINYGNEVYECLSKFYHKSFKYYRLCIRISNEDKFGRKVSALQLQELEKFRGEMYDAEDELTKPENFPHHHSKKRLLEEMTKSLKIHFSDDIPIVQSISMLISKLTNRQ